MDFEKKISFQQNFKSRVLMRNEKSKIRAGWSNTDL
jgi:hypothetical protein